MSTRAELLTIPTQDEILTSLYTKLAAKGFPVTNWASGGIERNIVETVAEIVFDLASPLATEIAGWQLLEDAEGDALTILARSNFETTRLPAEYERRWVKFTDAESAGPFTFAIGAHHITTPDGLTFTSVTGGTLALDDDLFVLFRSDSPGEDYASAITDDSVWNTPLAGVTVDFTPAALADELAAQETTGADEEADTQLKQRCRDQWATLGMGSTGAAFEERILAEDTTLTRILVLENTPTAGEIKVYLATASGPASGGQVSTIQAFLEDDERRPLCTTVDVEAASEVSVDITATVRVDATKAAAYSAAVNAALDSFFNGFRISKGDYSAFGTTGIDVVRPTKILNALHDVLDETSVASITLTSPSSNTLLDIGQIPKRGTTSITVIGI